MTTPERMSWMQVGMIIGAMAGLATIHASMIVPAILDHAEITARELDRTVAATARAELQAHLDETEVIRSKYMTKDEFSQFRNELDLIHKQLDRIEEALKK